LFDVFLFNLRFLNLSHYIKIFILEP
jgi:hypothetical protein